MKKFNSSSYYPKKLYVKNSEIYSCEDPNGYLFTKKGYRTKIKPEDLPEWYVYGYFHKCWCYISAKGVKDIAFLPTYNNHIHKDDYLVVSYNKKIVIGDFIYETKNYDEFFGYDEKYIESVEKYSDIDLSDIKKRVQYKEDWYYENYLE